MKIQGYSWMRKSNPNSRGVSSPSFRVGVGTRWHVGFYPSGTTPETTGFVSLKAVLDAAYAAIKAVVAFDVLDHAGNPVPRYARTSGEVLQEFAGAGAYWSCDDFLERAELERHLLKDDCFTVRCSVTVIEILAYEHEYDPPRSVVVPPSDWPQSFRRLLWSGEGADVRFRVAGETFAAHRCVLAARSPVFRAQLYGAMKESAQECVQIDGMRAEVFRDLLHFVYTDSLPEEEKEDASDVVAMAQHLMEAADRYGMERLKLVCEDRLCRRMDVSTVATTLTLAEQHRCQGLKDACFHFLINSPTILDEAMATDDFDHLSKTCPALFKELMSKLAAHSSTLTDKVARLAAYNKRLVCACTDNSKQKKRKLLTDARR